jgi:hypothetical protein
MHPRQTALHQLTAALLALLFHYVHLRFASNIRILLPSTGNVNATQK